MPSQAQQRDSIKENCLPISRVQLLASRVAGAGQISNQALSTYQFLPNCFCHICLDSQSIKVTETPASYFPFHWWGNWGPGRRSQPLSGSCSLVHGFVPEGPTKHSHQLRPSRKCVVQLLLQAPWLKQTLTQPAWTLQKPAEETALWSFRDEEKRRKQLLWVTLNLRALSLGCHLSTTPSLCFLSVSYK